MLTVLTISIMILGIYDFHFFWALRREPNEPDPETWPPVTVLTCAKDDNEGVLSLAAQFATQDYPAPVQWVLVDDGGSLNPELASYLPSNWEFTLVTLLEKEVPGKKGAVLEGWKHVRHDFVFSIDADGLPKSDLWLREMARPLANGKPIVLGFVEYREHAGLLNGLIQFETAQTASLFMSSAQKGKPYMAKGCNWGYKVWDTIEDDLRSDIDVLSGDDSLLVRRRKPKSAGLKWRAESQTVSEPPLSWKSWIDQKTRHSGAGWRFSGRSLFYLGMYNLAQLGLYAGLVLSLIFDQHILLTLSLFASYIVLSTFLRQPFLSAIGKTRLLWKRWFLEPLLLLFMFLWWTKSLAPRKNWNAPT